MLNENMSSIFNCQRKETEYDYQKLDPEMSNVSESLKVWYAHF